MLHTLVAWVEDRPGVLARMSGMFSRRNFNIQSLMVGSSETPGLSRMTIVVDPGRMDVSIVEQNLRKIVDVVDVQDVTGVPSVRRELALIKVRADAQSRIGIAQLAEIFRARVIDVGLESVIVEACADSEKIDRLIEVLKPQGIVELMRTGRVAMTRDIDPLAEDDAQ